jgi:deoxyxylulose-5-phosphate synthase
VVRPITELSNANHDTIHTPEDLRKLKMEQVKQVADELRQETIESTNFSP